MVILKAATDLSEKQHIGLYIEQAAIQNAHSYNRKEKAKSYAKITLAYQKLVKTQADVSSFYTYAITFSFGQTEVSKQFMRDHELLQKAIDYARSLLLDPYSIAKHDLEMLQYVEEIHNSERRYNNKNIPFNYNKYTIDDFKRPRNQMFK